MHPYMYQVTGLYCVIRMNCPLPMSLSLFRYQQHSLALMEAYDPRSNVWIKLADMGSPCSGLGACALFGLLYTVGRTSSIKPPIKCHYEND